MSTNSSSPAEQNGEIDDSEISQIEDDIWLAYKNNSDGDNINVYNESLNNTDGGNLTATGTLAPTSIIEKIFNSTWPPNADINSTSTNGTTLGDYYGRPTNPRPVTPTLPPAWNGQYPPPPPQQQYAPFPQPNMIIVGVLIALIVILGMVLGVVTIPPLINYFRRKMPVSQKRIDRRYATIDGWLITKTVKPHSDVCDRVRKYYGLDDNHSNEGCEGDGEEVEAANTNEFCVQVRKVTSGGDRSKRKPLRRVEVDKLLSTESFASIQKKVSQSQKRPDSPSSMPKALQQTNSLGSTVTEATTMTNLSRSSSSPSSLQIPENGRDISVNVDVNGSVDAEAQHDDENPPPSSSPASDPDTDVLICQVTAEQDGGCCPHDDNASCGELSSHSCPICLEKYEVGDLVSWSASLDCCHVFHYACIREWLLRRIGCPCCREIVLPVDRPPPPSEPPLEPQEGPLVTRMYHSVARHARNQTRRRRFLPKTALQDLASERATRAATSFFCVQDGLVTLLPKMLNHPLTQVNQRQLDLHRRLQERMRRKQKASESKSSPISSTTVLSVDESNANQAPDSIVPGDGEVVVFDAIAESLVEAADDSAVNCNDVDDEGSVYEV